MDNHLLFTNIQHLFGVYPAHPKVLKGNRMSVVPSMMGAEIRVMNGKITEMGQQLSRYHAQIVDLKGASVFPGLVDSHTHAVFAASREEEFRMRILGKSYEEIAAAGGGILNSAEKLSVISEEELFQLSVHRVKQLIAHGTTTLEIKSGYGLSTASELKMLRVIKRLKKHFPIPIYSTFLGAHAFPKAFKEQPDTYVSLIINEMLPQVHKEELADFIDVFCDRGFFTPEQTASILTAAAAYNLRPKIHANELGITGGVQVGVQFNALSVDHLEHCGQDELEALKNSETIPVGLPGTSYFLGLPYTPGRAIIDFGLPFALASDFNPGSSPLVSLQMVWSMGCTQMKLTPEEAFNAITINAAAALGDTNAGAIFPGAPAHFFTTFTENPLHTIPYYFAQNHVHQVFVNGIPI